MVTFTVPQSCEDKQETSLCHIQCRERYGWWKQIPTLDDIQWFYLVSMHQKFRAFKPMKSKPGLSVVCPVFPSSADVMKQVATAESLRVSGSSRWRLVPMGGPFGNGWWPQGGQSSVSPPRVQSCSTWMWRVTQHKCRWTEAASRWTMTRQDWRNEAEHRCGVKVQTCKVDGQAQARLLCSSLKDQDWGLELRGGFQGNRRVSQWGFSQCYPRQIFPSSQCQGHTVAPPTARWPWAQAGEPWGVASSWVMQR